MSAVVAAVAISAASGAYGAYEAGKAGKEARKEAGKARRSSEAIQREQLGFSQEQYEDWKSIYGDIQEQLSEYYKNLDPDAIEAMGITRIEQNYSEGLRKLEENLAQRGITGGGTHAAALTALEAERASGRAGVELTAPMTIAEMKSGFLGSGVNQRSSAVSGISGALTTMGNYESNLANYYRGVQSEAEAGQAQSIGQIGRAIGQYAMYNAYDNGPSNQPTVVTTDRKPLTYIDDTYGRV